MDDSLIDALPGAKWVVISPGRVNLLGEHVDYNDGLVLPAAIDRYVRVAYVPRADGVVRMRSLNLDAYASFQISAVDSKLDVDGRPLPKWALYPAGVAWSLIEAGFSPGGMEAVIQSNVPIGAGLSSSAAVELAFAAAWQQMGDWKIERMRLAQLCQRAENEFVGVHCGLMDQFACAHGVARHALYFDTRSLAWQPIPLPLKTSIVIADSAVERELAASAYNQRREECRTALAHARAVLPDVRSLRDIAVDDLAMLEKHIPEIAFMRMQHVVEEIERVRLGCQMLFADDAAGFGKLMVDGHASLRDLFAVSIPALDTLVEIAQELPGCYGARLTGAGFGGCTVNLVESDKADEFGMQLEEGYMKQTGLRAKVYVCKPSRGVYIKPIP
jgi:galactokinase